MSGCQYASCKKPGTQEADGYSFCMGHLREHMALVHGAPWPRRLSVLELPGELCGSTAGARRHNRNGEAACARCCEAERVRRLGARQRVSA